MTLTAWGTALSDQAQTKKDTEADELFTQANGKLM